MDHKLNKILIKEFLLNFIIYYKQFIKSIQNDIIVDILFTK